jgi:P4 family phage/plasmid primase-like protien
MDASMADEPKTAEQRIAAAISFLRMIFAPDDWIEIRLLPWAASRWFQLANESQTLATLRWCAECNARERDPQNIYFGIAPKTGSGKRGNDAAKLFRVAFADCDNTSVEESLQRWRDAGLPEPSFATFTGGGAHIYSALEQPITDRDTYTSIIKGIAHVLKSDSSMADADQLLRVVGFDNVKPKYEGRPTVRLVLRNDTRHPADRFPVKAIKKRTVKRSKKPPRGRLCDEGQRFLETGAVSGERRPALFRIACDMQARGWELGQAIEAIMSRVDKIKPPLKPDEIDDVPRQIENAFSQEREPGYEATPHAKAGRALVIDATAGDGPHGGTDLSRPCTWSDDPLARRLARTIRGRLAYVRERQMWIGFDGRRWAERADHLAMQACKRLRDELWCEVAELPEGERMAAAQWVQSTGTKRCIDAVVGLARSEPGISVSQAEFDDHPWLLNVQNGVLDLRSGELRPHDPALRITQLANVAYDPDARSELWERFICDVTCGDDEIANFLQQAFGLALTGDVSDEVLICHSGGGCNGKSTALEAIGKMLGDYAAVAPPGLFTARNFDSHPTEIAVLHGKRFVTAIEQEANRALRESLVKSLTGGDTIRTRRMREDFWEMKPTWHLHVAYNRAPRLTGTDDGIRRRLRIVPWGASFKDRPDLTVKERLIGQVERPGILAWCVEGLRRRLAVGRLESPAAVMIATDEYIDDEDLVGRFIADRCIEGAHEQAEIRSMLAAFRAWMAEDGAPRHVIDGFTVNLLGRELARRGFAKRRPDSGPYRKRVVYAGLSVASACEYAQPGEDWSDPFR